MRASFFVWVCVHAGAFLGAERVTGRRLEPVDGLERSGASLQLEFEDQTDGDRIVEAGDRTRLGLTTDEVIEKKGIVKVPVSVGNVQDIVRLHVMRRSESSPWLAWAFGVTGEKNVRFLTASGGAMADDLNIDVELETDIATIKAPERLGELMSQLESDALMLGVLVEGDDQAPTVRVTWPPALRKANVVVDFARSGEKYSVTRVAVNGEEKIGAGGETVTMGLTRVQATITDASRLQSMLQLLIPRE